MSLPCKSALVVYPALIAAVLCGGANGFASTEPTAPATPTGCTTNVFELEVKASPDWGVVPFRAHLSVYLKSRTDSIEMVWWDFESDGMVEVAGREVAHTFDDPEDRVVTATVRTRERGEIEIQKVVSGHTGIMSITFDDGCRSVHSNAMPMLEERGVQATAYIVPAWVKENSPVQMSWDQIWELALHGWDIGSHSMNHVNLADADDSTLHYELSQSRHELRLRGFDPVNFSLPYGAFDGRTIGAARMYYESCRAVGHALNPPVEFVDPYMIFCKSSQQWRPLSFYQAGVDSVAASGGWYILNNHRVWDDCYSAPDCIQTQKLADVVDYALSRRLRVASVRNVLKYGKTLEVNARLPDGPGGDPQRRTRVEWAFPNPFSLPGTIEFRLPAAAAATARIYDCTGRHVRDLQCGGRETVDHHVRWDGLNADGERVAGGTYYCVVSAAGETHSSGAILIVR